MTECFLVESYQLYSSVGMVEDHSGHVLFEGTVKTSVVLYCFLFTASPYR